MREYPYNAPRIYPRYTRKSVQNGRADIAALYPDLMPEWDDDRSPASVLPNSHKNIRWRCPRGHRYEAMPYSRIRGSGCPYCANRKVLAGFNDLATVCPDVAAEWAEDLNGVLTPADVTKGSTRKVWWRCRFGHEWRATVYSRTREKRSGCPLCQGKYRDPR